MTRVTQSHDLDRSRTLPSIEGGDSIERQTPEGLKTCDRVIPSSAQADLTKRPARRPVPQVRVTSTEGLTTVQPLTAGSTIDDLLPGSDVATIRALVKLLLVATGNDEAGTNDLLALVAGLEPNDTGEAMLAAMTAITGTIAARAAARAGVSIDHARLAATAARTSADVLGRLDARRRPAGVQTIRVEKITAGQVAVACSTGGGGPGEGSPK